MSNKRTFPNTKQEVKSRPCGPSCLLNIYKHFGVKISLQKVLKELSVKNSESIHLSQLARHLREHKLKTIILSSCAYNISPDWQGKSNKIIINNLKKWVTHNSQDRWLKNVLFLLFYLQEGGELKIVDLSTKIIDKYLDKRNLILSCLEESWLWGKRRISGGKAKYDSVRGHSRGHFVVVYGKKGNEYLISDPYPTKIKGREGLYSVNKDKFLVSTIIWGAQVLVIGK